jgi:hypothetical protein
MEGAMNLLLKGLFGSLIFSQCLLGFSFAVISDGLHTPSVEEEMQAKQLKTVKKVTQVAECILSTPEEEMNFENTLGLWQKLMEQISSNADGMTNQGIGAAFLAEMQNSPEFYLALKRNALSILREKSSNVFQKHIARCFLDNCEQKDQHNFLYLNGCVEEKNGTQNEFTIMNLTINNISKDQIIELTDQVLDSKADILCLREVSTEDMPSLFDAFKNDYAHIYIATNVCGAEFFSTNPWIKGSIFIASKYALENMKIRSLQSSIENELLDFVIKGNQSPLGHVYSIEQEFSEDKHVEQFAELMEILQGDFLETVTRDEIPFVVCGDLGDSDLNKAFVSKYFRWGNKEEGHALLLQSLPAFTTEKVCQKYTIVTASLPLTDRIGLLTRIREKNHFPIEGIATNLRSHDGLENKIILCGGKADVSYDRDSDGNTTVEAGVSGTKETDYGDFSVDVRGGVSRDKDGNTSGHVSLEGYWEF